MAVILGIDLGTSSLKAMLLDEETGVLDVRVKEYGVDIPHPGYAQQNPRVWWEALKEVLGKLREEWPEAFSRVAAVGYSGQMHGLVLAGEDGSPLCPAIIWMDQRSGACLQEIENRMSREEMGRQLCNRVSSGFAFPSLLWVKEEKPEWFVRAETVFCPKDYLRFLMTGERGAEVVDASSTGMFDTARRDWAWELLDDWGLPERLFPEVKESCQVAGTISSWCAGETGLREGIPVIYGSGDQPAQSIGNGVIQEGRLIANIGTGGQISAFSRKPVYDAKLRTNTFCHAVEGAWTIFGATLSAGMSLGWLKNRLFREESYETVNREAKAAGPGAGGLLYLPYLSGERTPHMNPRARGMFFGLTLGQERGEFFRAVMEGVTYSLRDCLEVLKETGVDGEEILASGGGASSRLWLQIQADILEKPVRACRVKEQACLGSCILAGYGTGILPSLEEGCRRFSVLDEEVFFPEEKNREIYGEGYRKFRELYRRTEELMEREGAE